MPEQAGREESGFGEPVATLKVQWRDVDALGHVNNAVYVSYLESARLEYYEKTFGEEGFHRFPFIIAEITVKFLSPAYIKELLDLHIRISEVGRKSFRFRYAIRSRTDGRVVCEAESVQVFYDYEAGRTVEVSDEWKAIAGMPA
ncbi:MAG: acyl-CoA thioesterase [Myxococcota bacterium]